MIPFITFPQMLKAENTSCILYASNRNSNHRLNQGDNDDDVEDDPVYENLTYNRTNTQ